MEIVSKPDMRSAEEAKAYVTKLRTILRYLGTCDGNMEEGSMRADVNVSVRKPGGPLRHALRDQERQLDPLHAAGDRIRGAPPDRHSRGRRQDRSGNPPVRPGNKGETRSMRSKEEAHDYRYFPDPDLLPLELEQGLGRRRDQANPARTARPEKARFMRKITACPPMTPRVLIAERPRADYFEAVAKGRDGKLAANWVINELFGR
jgi:aspartyl-tRNA(Asn)/glutamyl-tRNA(Gln) amidotransferase subunit B